LNFDKNDIIHKNRIKQILSKEMIDQIATELVFRDIDTIGELEIDSKLKDILSLISKGENTQVEFKESLSVPINNHTKISEKIENLNQIIRTNKRQELEVDLKDKIHEIQSTKTEVLIHSAFKNIVAFANTKGGDLFIGVDDKGVITGLGPDYSKFFKEINPNDVYSLRDKFRLYLDDLIIKWIDPEIRSLIDINIYNHNNLDFCHIAIQKKTTRNLIYLYYDIDKKTQNKIDSKTWYYRGVANARAYTSEELVSYYTNLIN
jgi:predicted HTH transcriptional regulator